LRQSFDLLCAGQWKFGQDRLKLQWAALADSQTLLDKLSGKQHSTRPDAAIAGSPTTWDVLAEAPVDALTGKLPLLLGAEELDKQFWSCTKPGRAMLEQVRCFCCTMHRWFVLCIAWYKVQHMCLGLRSEWLNYVDWQAAAAAGC
jgi:hypothetical protein